MSFTPQPLLEDFTATGQIGALDETIELTLAGVSGGKAVVSGTWNGTIKFEGSVDGLRWDNIGTFSGTTGAILSQTGITANDLLVFVGIAGLFKLRARFHIYSSGTATVTFRASNGVSNVFVDNLIARNLKSEIYGVDKSGNSAVFSMNTVLGETGSHIISTPIEAEKVKANELFGFSFESSISGVNESNFLYLENPSGSGKKIYLLRTSLSSLGGASGTWRLYHAPTGTIGGTTINIINQNFSDIPPASVMIIKGASLTGVTTQGTRALTQTSGSNDTSFLNDFQFGLSIDPGHKFLISAQRSIGNGLMICNLIWAEINL